MDFQKEAPTAIEANQTSLKNVQNNNTTTPQVDKKQLELFVDALFRYAPDGYVALRGFKPTNGNGQSQLICKEFVSILDEQAVVDAAYAGAVAAAKIKGAVYCPPVATFKGTDKAGQDDVCLGVALSQEIDDGDPAADVAKLSAVLGVIPTVVVESGGVIVDEETAEVIPKLHAHWRLKEPTSTPKEHAKLKRLRKLCTMFIGADATNDPISHPIRWPGTLHTKAEPRLCKIAQLNDSAEIDLDDALERISAVVTEEERQAVNGSTTGKRNDPSVYVQARDAIRSGKNYHQSLVRLSAKYSSEGMGTRAIRELLTAEMEASEAPRDERWLDRVNAIPGIVKTAHEKFFRESYDETAVSELFEKLEMARAENGWQIVPFGLDTDPDLSHDALALELSKAGFAKDARYVSSIGKWYFWTGTHWRIDDRLLHMTAVRDYLRVKAAKLIEWAEKKSAELPDQKSIDKLMKWAKENAKSIRQASGVASVESVARSNSDLVASIDQFDADLMLLGTPTGTVDLRSGELIEPQRNHWITKQAAVEPAPPGTQPRLWLKFLDRIFDGNQELIDFMQRAAGYALTGRTDEHKLLFLFGTGSNGKSVFLNTLYNIMGDYSKRAASQTFLNSHGDRHPTDLAGLMGARLVAGSELPAGKAWNESVIKDLTGGDVITARFMRQDFFDFMPQFTLFIAGNHRPSFSGIDEAIRRRVCLVPFTQTIPAEERDPELPTKLESEWPAILRWAIDGAIEWQRIGLAVPDTVSAASAEYMEDEDTLSDFFDENVSKIEFANVAVADVYSRFCKWQRVNGLSNPWTKSAMTRTFTERGMRSEKINGQRSYKGMCLKPEPAHYSKAWHDFD